jgi:hypothetical protein
MNVKALAMLGTERRNNPRGKRHKSHRIHSNKPISVELWGSLLDQSAQKIQLQMEISSLLTAREKEKERERRE